MNDMMYMKDVVTLELNRDGCIGCGMCLTVCPRGVFEMDAGKARIVLRDACIECGACARNCPARVIAVDTGTGCATGMINRALGRKGACCCSEESCCD